MSKSINLNAKPAEYIQYELGGVLQIDNPDGGYPMQVDCETRADIPAALKEICEWTGKTLDDYYVTGDCE